MILRVLRAACGRPGTAVLTVVLAVAAPFDRTWFDKGTTVLGILALGITALARKAAS